MEDSYTVHRRRKAAARRREKTPDPPRRHQDDVAATSDEEDEARARMERLVLETERLEELEESERRRIENEKSSDYVDSSVAEKPQRALKRAMSPEVRRIDDETRMDECPESKLSVDRSSFVVPESFDKTNSGNRTHRIEETKRMSDVPVQPEVAEQPNESVGEMTRKTKNEDVDVTPTRIARRRTEVDKDVSAKVMTKPGRFLKEALSPDVEKVEKNRIVSELKKDRAGSEDRRKKTASRTGDDQQDAALDKNRYEAAAVTRDSDVEAAIFVSGESVKQQDVKKVDEDADEKVDEDADEKLLKPAEDLLKKKKRRDVTSPLKSRSTESRAAPTTTTMKRSAKERNVEGSGYTTDSSETDTAKRIMNRKKSPEGAKIKSSSSSRKTPSRSRDTNDTDGDFEELEKKKNNKTRMSASRRRPSSETDEELTSSLLRQRKNSPSHSALERREAIPVASWQGEKRSSNRPKPPSDFQVDLQRNRSSSIARSSSEMKKQIIPLSDDTLIEDFERAQREYIRKERGILDRDPLDDDYVDPQMEAALRRRKFSIVTTESVAQAVQEGEKQLSEPVKRSWFGWFPFFGRKAKTEKEVEDEKVTKTEMEEKHPTEKEKPKEKPKSNLLKQEIPGPKKVSIVEFFRILADFLSEFKAFIEQNPRETRTIRILRNRCMAELLLAIIYCGLGAFVFRFTEGAFETFYKCGVKRVKRDFLDSLWNFSHNMREEDWKSMARRKLMEFEEQLHTAHEAGVHSYSGQKSWSFLNSVVYCLTVITTIGYGHISPSTTTGRAITIVYAIFGIPMFLIILADFGKLFTRGIKFLWAFVRRVYYTGSCRRVRRTVPVQEVMKGVQLVYDLATFRRPSQMNPEEIEEMQKQQNQTQTVLNLDGNTSASIPGTPGTPAMSTFAIDDEFNLPISVAIVILLVYIFVGATVYNFWEQWGFFESFYFVFISMSTIGFGDYVPKHPMYMMLSIVYLVFGLALTSMCINVVQVMLSDSFKQASQKIGATIGFEVAEEDGSIQPAVPPPVELADVHATIKGSESKEQVAPKAKQEDVEL